MDDLYDRYGIQSGALIAAANEILALPDLFEHLDLDKLRCQDGTQTNDRMVTTVQLNINCICSLTIGYSSALWNVLRRQYPDMLTGLRQRYQLPDVLVVNRELVATVIKQAIKRIRINLALDGLFLTDSNTKTLLYRFSSPDEFVASGPPVTISLRNLYDRGLLTHRELQRSGVDADVTFTFRQGQYRLRSAGKKNISLMEYLSTSLGQGGHISGWQYYSRNTANQIGSVAAGYRAFSDHGSRSLFVFQSADIQAGDLRHALLPPDRLNHTVQWVEISGEYGRYLDDDLGRAGTVTTHWVPYEPGVIKLVRAGYLMPAEAANPNEIDLIGEVDLYGCVVTASRPSSMVYELLMSALQRSNLVSLMMPLGTGLPSIDVPIPVPDDY